MPRAIGHIATSATTKVAVEATAYTEQASGAKRSLKSSSANDAAAGTGARKVKLTYYTLASDGTITGPFSETVSLNGTTAVATTATNIALVERLEVTDAGSGGVAAGTISLYDDDAGAGSVFGSIAAGEVRTHWAHHYVPSNRACEVTDLECLGGDTTTALVELVSMPPGGVEQPLTGQYGTTSTLARDEKIGVLIPGPARVEAQVTPGGAGAQTTRASFGYVDRLASGV